MAREKNANKEKIATSLCHLVKYSGISPDSIVASCPAIKNQKRLAEILNATRLPSVGEFVELCNVFEANADEILFGVSSYR